MTSDTVGFLVNNSGFVFQPTMACWSTHELKEHMEELCKTEDRGELPPETLYFVRIWGTAGILQPRLGHKFFSAVTIVRLTVTMWKRSGLRTLLVTEGPKRTLLPAILLWLLQKCGRHADAHVGSAAAVCPAAQFKSVMLSAQPLGSLLLFVFAVKLSEERQWDEVRGVGFALCRSHRWVLQRFWSNSKSAAAQRLYQGKARCMQSTLKCPLMKGGLTFCGIKRTLNQNLIYPGKSNFTI